MTDFEILYVSMLRILSGRIDRVRSEHPEIFFTDAEILNPDFDIDDYCSKLALAVLEFNPKAAKDTVPIAAFLLTYLLESGAYDRSKEYASSQNDSLLFGKFYDLACFGAQEVPKDLADSADFALQLITDERVNDALDAEGQALSRYDKLLDMSADRIRKSCLSMMITLLPFLPEQRIEQEFLAWNIPYRRQLRTELLKRRNSRFDPVSIRRRLDESIVGQDSEKTRLAAALYNHRLCYETGVQPPRNVILLTGPTGSGKTLTAKTIAACMDLPCVVCEASQITGEGWKGLDKADIFADLYSQSSDRKKCSYGIVVLDEFDKGCFQCRSSDGTDVGRMWQSNFLPMLEGTPVRKESKDNPAGISYETKNILFILTGSFGELRAREERTKRPGIGFSAGPASGSDTDWSTQSMQKKLVDIGLFPELVGRITAVLQLKELTEEQVYTALMSPTSDFLPLHRQLLTADGKELEIDETFIRSAIRQGLQDGLGVRGCRNLISERLMEATYEAFMQNTNVVRLGFRTKSNNQERSHA